MSRAITAPELAKLRTQGQRADLYLGVLTPATVYSARVNGAPASTDSLMELTYDGGSGTLADVLPGMTVYIGSTSGGYERGIGRVRAAPSATKFYIGETSEIEAADNDYITVVRDYGIWPRHIKRTGSTWQIDGVEYSDQHADRDPIAMMGPAVRVSQLTGASVAIACDWTGSSAPGSSVASYATTVTGGATIDDDTSSTPTITATAAGWYSIAATVTAANGKATTGYRWWYVWDTAHPPISPVVENLRGEVAAGGWSFRATLYDNAVLDTEVRDRALCVLFSRDYYSGVEESLGPVTGFENVVTVGWIDGETIEYSGEAGPVSFEIQGPAYWLDKMPAFPVGVKDVSSASTKWIFYNTLTLDAGLWHFCHHRSTVDTVIDVSYTGDDRRISATEAYAGSFWQQVSTIAGAILARPLCDRYGRLFFEIDPNRTTAADRASFPVVMEITTADWSHDEGLTIERRTKPEVSLLSASGVAWNGTTGTPCFSKAPGDVFRRHGAFETLDNLAITDQDELNDMAGLHLAWRNNEYPYVGLALVQNNRFLDIAPAQYVTLTLAAADTERGLVWTAKKFFPVSVSYEHRLGGVLVSKVELEAEVTAATARTDEKPQPPRQSDPGEPSTPTFPLTPPGHIWFPPIVPKPPDSAYDVCIAGAAQSGPYTLSWDKSELLSNDDTKRAATTYYPCTIRPAGVYFGTKLRIYGIYQKDVGGSWHEEDNTQDQWLTVEAIDSSGATVLTGVITPNYRVIEVAFSPVSPTAVAGFKITIDAASAEGWTVGSLITTGTAIPTSSTGTAVSVTEGQSYVAIGLSGYWIPAPFWGHYYTGLRVRAQKTDEEVVGLYNDTLYNAHFVTIAAGNGATAYVYQGDSYYGDNSGPGISWGFYHATRGSGEVYRALLDNASLVNVCPLSS